MTGVTRGAGTAYSSRAPKFIPQFLVGFVLLTVFCVMFCRRLFVPLSFLLWPLYCLSFFDLWFLIILWLLVSPALSTFSALIDYPFGVFKLFFINYSVYHM